MNLSDDKNDWRLQNQEKYLFSVTLYFKKYAEKKTETDHDHCEFCWQKFSNSILGSLVQGYTTADDYHWICEKCYEDFKGIAADILSERKI